MWCARTHLPACLPAVPLLGYVHFDEMRVLNAELRKVENAKSSETASQAVAGAFGTGLLMGMFAMCTFRDTGCKTAELLAINDNGKVGACLFHR